MESLRNHVISRCGVIFRGFEEYVNNSLAIKYNDHLTQLNNYQSQCD